MDMPFELQIALRYLLAKRKQAFISVISLISTLGVTVGVMALVIALALMTGLQQELRDRILGSNAHVYVFKTGGIADYRAEMPKLLAMPHVVGAAPAIQGKGLLSAAGDTQPIQIKGIDSRSSRRSPTSRRAIAERQRRRRCRAGDGGPDGILLGEDLAAKLGVRVGDSVSLVTPQGTLSPIGMMPRPPAPARRRHLQPRPLRVRLHLRLRLARRREAAVREGPGRSDPAARRRHLRRAATSRKAIPAALGREYLAEDWAAMNKSLFSALWLEKMAISLTIGLIVMVAALNIVASLILLVMEKNRDIAILKTMGASARSVTAIFMMQGLIIGLVGTTVGRVGRLRAVVRARSLRADQGAGGRLPGLARAVHGAAARLRAWSSSRRSSSASWRRSIRRARRRSSIRRRR